jgi:TPR repeat protein
VAPESTSLAAAASAHHFERAHLLCTEAKFASAVAEYEKGIALGHGASHAELANILIDGRNGVPCDIFRAFELADKGSRLCCPHSQGVLAWCYAQGLGAPKDRSRALKLARESAAADSRYGHFALGELTFSYEGSASAYEESVTHTELAAAQNLVRI